jgi:hypothetical protein
MLQICPDIQLNHGMQNNPWFHRMSTDKEFLFFASHRQRVLCAFCDIRNTSDDMLIFITSPLSLPSVPSKSITRVHGSMFWAFANHIPFVVCDLKFHEMLVNLRTQVYTRAK